MEVSFFVVMVVQYLGQFYFTAKNTHRNYFYTHSNETFQGNCYLEKLHLNSVCINCEVKVDMSVGDTVESYACFMYAFYINKLYFEKNYKAHLNGNFSSVAAMCLKLRVLA